MTPTHNTLALLRHFRAFLASDCREMVDPYSGGWRLRLDKPAAHRKLRWLVNVAVNRRAGVPDEPGRTPDYIWRRDQRAIHDRLQRRVALHYLETRTARERFGHLLDRT